MDAPSSMRGIRVKGGKDTVQINFSKKSIKIIGALGQGTFDMQFHQKTDAQSVIAFLEYLRYRYGSVFVILDNAAAHTGKQMDEYIKSTKMSSCGFCLRVPCSTIQLRYNGAR